MVIFRKKIIGYSLEVSCETVWSQIIVCARLYPDWLSAQSGIHIISSAPYFSSYVHGAHYNLQAFNNFHIRTVDLDIIKVFLVTNWSTSELS
jgi:MarR-like DNA-binding transcriptional regulator SgrR of sgrS sRNA